MSIRPSSIVRRSLPLQLLAAVSLAALPAYAAPTKGSKKVVRKHHKPKKITKKVVRIEALKTVDPVVNTSNLTIAPEFEAAMRAGIKSATLTPADLKEPFASMSFRWPDLVSTSRAMLVEHRWPDPPLWAAPRAVISIDPRWIPSGLVRVDCAVATTPNKASHRTVRVRATIHETMTTASEHGTHGVEVKQGKLIFVIVFDPATLNGALSADITLSPADELGAQLSIYQCKVTPETE